MKKIYSLVTILLVTLASNAQVVISQVYGGGGNAGATYSNDFIELYNRGTTSQSLAGWSVQYASSTGPTAPNTWFVTNLPNVTLLPGQYFLIQEAAGATASLALPTPDLDGLTCGCTYGSAATPTLQPTGIALSSTNGKVILVSTIVAETTNNPSGTQIIDKVGYGTAPTGFEGTGPTGTALSSSTSAQRNSAGCVDSNNNAADFTASTPAPRNTATAINNCSLSANQNSIAGLSIYPNPVKNGKLFIITNDNTERNVTVFDVLGKQVLNVTIATSEINVSTLNAGVYIVKITEEGNTATRKLVIQ